MKRNETSRFLWALLLTAVPMVAMPGQTPVAAQEPLNRPPITDLNDFFVFNSSGIPEIPADWRLNIDGAVAKPLALDIETIGQWRTATEMATLECAWSSGPLLWVGNAVWTGVPLRLLLETADPLPEATAIRFYAEDGYELGDLDLAEILANGEIMLAYAINGRELPPEQGYPLRLVAPGTGGFHWVQWVTRIEILTTEATWEFEDFPQHARVFWPESYSTQTVGPHTIRGMVMAGKGVEVTKVEVSFDATTWHDAKLTTEFVPNVWRHWEFEWDGPMLGHNIIYTRSTDATGAVQNERGAYGWRGFAVAVIGDEDGDGDGVADGVDNCPALYNPSQRDSDGDGTGDVCDADCPDLDGRNAVSFIDFAILAATWGDRKTLVDGDFNTDGIVDVYDLQYLSQHWLTRCFVETPGQGQSDSSASLN